MTKTKLNDLKTEELQELIELLAEKKLITQRIELYVTIHHILNERNEQKLNELHQN